MSSAKLARTIKALKEIVQRSSSTRWPGNSEAFELVCVTIHNLAKEALTDVGRPWSIVERMRAKGELPRKPKKRKPLERCAASVGDGECYHKDCPQNRDGEPMKTGRTCPLPWGSREEE